MVFLRNVVNNVTNNVVNDVVNQELSEDEELVLKLLNINPNLTAAKIAELINSRTIQRVMNELKNKKTIERIGGTRGYWKVIK